MRIGLVGTGSMGHAHAPSWKLLKNIGAELVGVVSNRSESTQAFAEQYDIRAYDTLDALIADVDILDICVPTNLHKDMTLKAASAGKHVICEKPMALSIADAQAMIDACREANVHLYIAHVVRFISQYQLAKHSIDSGQIGTPCVIRLSRAGYQPRKKTDNWFTDESRSGGMMLDLMVHDYDYARWIGGNVKRVYARSVRGTTPDAPGDYALVTLRFEDSAIAHIEGGWAYPVGFFRTSMDIAGTDGVIEFMSDNAQSLYTHLANPPDVEADEVAVPAAKAADSPFTAQLRNFYNAIVHDEAPVVTAEEALLALEVGLAAIESAKTGKPVTLNQEDS
ncbi:MAG: Gfo/Idh/MocA family oxidoreductase [Chloroflexota bacterium]